MDRCKLIGLGLIMVLVSGCCGGMKESLRGVAGISTKVLEDNLSSATSREFDLVYDNVYLKIEKVIREIGAYIYTVDKSKNLIAIYVNESDTTPVGIFFKALNDTRTRVSIASPSKFSQEFIAGKIFSGLEK